jgi:endoglucanase
VKDTLWAGGSTGSATCDGGAYQREVKRAVNWLLEQKMDVILDLHYVGGSPQSAHTTFWDNISKDSFFKDGRIIFELYNEPTDSVDTLRTWANTTIAKIRGNGAKNLILMSGPDYTYDLSGYVTTKVTDSGNATAYAVHPYIFKPSPDAWKTACGQLPVVATEFGDAKVPEMGHDIPPDKCEAATYSNYISSFESIGMGWTSWAWIVDEWGCGFPQLLADYSGTPNAIGTPVREKLLSFP